jgi:hypothetical protein
LNLESQPGDANQDALVLGLTQAHGDRLAQSLKELIERLPGRVTPFETADLGPIAGRFAVNVNFERSRVHVEHRNRSAIPCRPRRLSAPTISRPSPLTTNDGTCKENSTAIISRTRF